MLVGTQATLKMQELMKYCKYVHFQMLLSQRVYKKKVLLA